MVVSIATFLISIFAISILIAQNLYFAASIVDYAFTVLMLLVLGVLLFKSFSARNLTGVSILSVFVIGSIVFTQLIFLIKGMDLAFGALDQILYFISFVGLMIILTSLILSWYNEFGEQNLRISFLRTNPLSINQPNWGNSEKFTFYKDFLSKSENLEILITDLIYEAKGTNEEIEQQIRLIASKYRKLLRDRSRGFIPSENYSKRFNQIELELMSIIDLLFK